MKMKKDTHMQGSRASGFSLIELMVVVAIIGILASIALPSYNEHVRRTRRAAAASCVSAVAQQAERFYTTNLKYTGFVANTAICEPKALEFYSIGASGTPDAKTYTIQATRKGGMAGDACGELTLNQAGVKGKTGSVPINQCW